MKIEGLEHIRIAADTYMSFKNTRESFNVLAKKVQSQGAENFFEVNDYRFKVFEKLLHFLSDLDQIIQSGYNSLFEPVYLKDWKPGVDKPILVDHLAFSAAKSVYEAKVLIEMGEGLDANSDNAKLERAVREFKLFAEENLYPLVDDKARDSLDSLETIAIAEALDKRKKGEGGRFLVNHALLSQNVNIE